MTRRLAALAAGAGLFIGCSLPLWLVPDAPEYTDDSTADAVGFRDTARPKNDTLSRIEESIDPPLTCDVPSAAASVTCPVPVTTARPSTACSDDVLTEMLTCFAPKPDPTRCDAARKAHPVCAKCVFAEWMLEPYTTLALSLDTSACIRAIAPESSCADAWLCRRECLVAVCGECEPSSELDDCMARAAASDSGACWTLGLKDFVGCSEQARFAPCFPKTTAEHHTFLRGACVTGGDWSTSDAAGGD